MAYYYNKDELKNSLEIEQVYDLLDVLGGNPSYSGDDIIISDTICHNLPNEGSHKLYYYDSTKLCHCYTSCGSFDIFELIIKVAKLQWHKEWELYDAMHYVAQYFGIEGEAPQEEIEELPDWSLFDRHSFSLPQSCGQAIQLPEYNPVILTKFAYPRIISWEDEGISAKVARRNLIGYYPATEQITIPHFDADNRLVGIRGRFLGADMADRFGKYRPLVVNGIQYSHPLSMKLYNLNNSKENISQAKVAVVYESEKSCMKHSSFYGAANDISVACCGSNLSAQQVQMLVRLGVRELVIAFDRDFMEIGDDEFQRLKKKLKSIYKKYNNEIKITAIFDKECITSLHSSPIDESKDKFEYLLKNRIVPK